MADTTQAELTDDVRRIVHRAQYEYMRDHAGCHEFTDEAIASGVERRIADPHQRGLDAAVWAALRAAQPAEVAPDDEALLDAYLFEALHGTATTLFAAKLALRRRIAELRAEITTVRAVLKETEGYERNAEKRAEAAEAALETVKEQFNADGQHISDVLGDGWQYEVWPELKAALKECKAATIEECAAIATARRNQWSCAGGFGGHSAGARIIQDEILALKTKEPTNG